MNPQRANGFTIIELIVVLLVIAVTTGLAVPAFRRWVEEDDLTVATRQIETLFRVARDSAIRSGLPVTVAIDSATSRVWLLTSRSEAGVDATQNVQDSEEGTLLDLPASVSLQLSQPRAQFRFRSTGAVFADSLRLNTPYESRLVTLNPWSGDVMQ